MKRLRQKLSKLPLFRGLMVLVALVYFWMGGTVSIDFDITSPVKNEEIVRIADTTDAVITPVAEASVMPVFNPEPERDPEEMIDELARVSASQLQIPKGTDAHRVKYINKWKETAVKERLLSGVPASIIMAQSGLESDWGRSDLATIAFNHFGMKHHGTIPDYVTGKMKKKERDGTWAYFRKYPSAWFSYRDHTRLLTSGQYRRIDNACGGNYRCWAMWLGPKTDRAPWRTNYADDPEYAEKLIKLINDLNLWQLDGGKIDHYEKTTGLPIIAR